MSRTLAALLILGIRVRESPESLRMSPCPYLRKGRAKLSAASGDAPCAFEDSESRVVAIR
jgi:hypothetical protein